jgi:1-acyl-sn-glycerol-3-phosphate acyltransferase
MSVRRRSFASAARREERMIAGAREVIGRLEIPFDRLGVDPFGTSKTHLAAALAALSPLYRRYFAVETRGMGHVPARGRAMLVGNHSGGVAIDAVMVALSCLLDLDPPRLAQGMAERFIARIPFLGELAVRTGQLPGLPEHAERLLENERLLLVFPEGARGTAKLFRERNSLVAFGTGFMRLALKTKAPVVPVAVLGGGEAFPTVLNAYKLGRSFGLPYLPIVAYGIPLPLPAKIEIEYGSPMRFEGTGNEDDEVVVRHVETVKGVIARMLDAGARRRRGSAEGRGGVAPERGTAGLPRAGGGG